MLSQKKRVEKTVQEVMAEEERPQERIDPDGNRWRKVYVGGGEHFRNWLAQCKELGEVKIEEVDASRFRCFSESGEKMYRIWMKIGATPEDDLVR